MKYTVILILLVFPSVLSAEIGGDIKFLATADPQYENNPAETIQRFTKRYYTDQTMAAINNKLATKNYMGVVVAGDLTQNAWDSEFESYLEAVGSHEMFYYHGLGNHDYFSGFCIVTPFSSCGNNIKNHIRARPVKFSYQELGDGVAIPISVALNMSDYHYSWDWNGVHFIQLNLLPGISTHGGSNELTPDLSQLFLINDLYTKVGNTGKPVVLIHHYCLNPNLMVNSTPICEWWPEGEKEAYWNIIAPFNVVAIITGHVHNPSGYKWIYEWPRPAGSMNGPEAIPSFVVGSAAHGRHTEIEITDSFLKAEITVEDKFDFASGDILAGSRRCMKYPLKNGRPDTSANTEC